VYCVGLLERGRQQAKFRFLDSSCRTSSAQGKKRDYVLCGDWNIATGKST